MKTYLGNWEVGSMTDGLMDDVTRGNDPPPELEPVNQGYAAQIEGLQRELRDAKEQHQQMMEKEYAMREEQVNSAQNAWAERDALQRELKDSQALVRPCLQLIAHLIKALT